MPPRLSAPTRQRRPQGDSSGGVITYHDLAWSHRDLALMEANWAAGDEPVMDNPLGGIRRGWPEIRPTYARLFGSQASLSVEFFDYTIHELGDAFIAIGRERGTLRKAELNLDVAIRTSRLFARRDGRWRQLHHHGSIEDPDLLAQYKAAFA